MTIQNGNGHVTSDEIDYLDNLGSFGLPNRTNKKNRIELLENYISAMKLRSKWEGKDKDKILSHAMGLLKKEKRRS